MFWRGLACYLVAGVPLEERETKFTPGVIPLTVEMFSSSVSDESDTENEGSKRYEMQPQLAWRCRLCFKCP